MSTKGSSDHSWLRLDRLALLSLPSLVLLNSLVSFVKYQEYPLLSVEIAYLVMTILAIGLCLSLIMWLGGRVGKALVLFAIIIVFLDFQFELRIRYLAMGGLVLLVACWFLAQPLLRILTVSFSVILVSTLILPTQLRGTAIKLDSSGVSRPDLPPILHIILDGHIGIEGIDRGPERSREIRDGLKTFYQANGFRVFGGAHSNYVDTFDSIPNILNSTTSVTKDEYIDSDTGVLLAVKKNAYLATLSKAGYQVRIYQSKYFNFCEDADIRLISCDSYNYTGLGELNKFTDDSSVLATLIAARYLNRSRLYGLARSYYQGLAAAKFMKLRRIENNNYAPLAAVPSLDLIARDIAKAPEGKVFFAHLLIPHRPYMFDAKCKIVLDHAYDILQIKSPAWQREFRKAYYEQVACLSSRMKRLFDAMKAAGVYDKTIIVVHGDHGSRIGSANPTTKSWKSLDITDIRSYFSTLFAIKAPGIEAGYDDRLFAVGNLLHSMIGPNGIGTIPKPRDGHFVYLQTPGSTIMQKTALPDFRTGH